MFKIANCHNIFIKSKYVQNIKFYELDSWLEAFKVHVASSRVRNDSIGWYCIFDFFVSRLRS